MQLPEFLAHQGFHRAEVQTYLERLRLEIILQATAHMSIQKVRLKLSCGRRLEALQEVPAPTMISSCLYYYWRYLLHLQSCWQQSSSITTLQNVHDLSPHHYFWTTIPLPPISQIAESKVTQCLWHVHFLWLTAYLPELTTLPLMLGFVS